MPTSSGTASGTKSRADRRHNRPAPPLEATMREVLHTLGDIDFQHEAALERLTASHVDHQTKMNIRQELLARHQERRRLYLELLAGFRHKQHREALAA